MPIDKAVDSAVLDANLLSVADAIRAKAGTSEEMVFPDGFVEAIESLASGGGGLTYDMGEFVVDSDVKHLRSSTDGVPHALGETPEFILIWTDDFSNLSADNTSPYTTNTYVGYLWLKGLTGLEQRLSSSFSSEYGLFLGLQIHITTHTIAPVSPTSAVYTMSDGYMPTSEVIGVPVIGGSVWLRAGVTYKYFVSKAWWNVGGVANA